MKRPPASRQKVSTKVWASIIAGLLAAAAAHYGPNAYAPESPLFE